MCVCVLVPCGSVSRRSAAQFFSMGFCFVFVWCRRSLGEEREGNQVGMLKSAMGRQEAETSHFIC